MQAIADNVYIEDSYPGVTLGAVSLAHGLVQIDAPPALEDGRSWRAALLNLNGGPERILVNLDPHPDRTIGARQMDCSIIAHEKTAQAFRNRSTTFKAQTEETGAIWETLNSLGSVRWAPPEITFTDSLEIHWGNTPVLLEHHPGPSAGAIWVILPEERIVFVGDAVVKNQPPFLAFADLPVWIENLGSLLSSRFNQYTVVSGRGGTVSGLLIRSQLDFLKKLEKQIQKLGGKQAPPEASETLVQPLLTALKIPASRQKQFTPRLRYGLYQYYSRHYHPSKAQTDE
jgi:glyoxylase-like metal-dependent hydrolase (beta-lactamase superfamily II)